MKTPHMEKHDMGHVWLLNFVTMGVKATSLYEET